MQGAGMLLRLSLMELTDHSKGTDWDVAQRFQNQRYRPIFPSPYAEHRGTAISDLLHSRVGLHSRKGEGLHERSQTRDARPAIASLHRVSYSLWQETKGLILSLRIVG